MHCKENYGNDKWKAKMKIENRWTKWKKDNRKWNRKKLNEELKENGGGKSLGKWKERTKTEDGSEENNGNV